MCDQITTFSRRFSHLISADLGKNYNTQHTLFNLVQNWQKCLDNSGSVGTILMDLSKAYDCVPYDLLKAKWKPMDLIITA